MKYLVTFYISIILMGCTYSGIKPVCKTGDKICKFDNNKNISKCDSIIEIYMAIIRQKNKYYRYDHHVSENIRIEDIIKCALDTPNIYDPLVQQALLSYCDSFIEFVISNDMKPTIYNKDDYIGKILTSIVSHDCFKLHMKIFQYNECNSHGSDVIESSTGVSYFEYMMLPLIKNINGQDAMEWYKQYKMENLFFDYRDDCDLYYYNLLYAYIKKAWEEGKIELNATNVK